MKQKHGKMRFLLKSVFLAAVIWLGLTAGETPITTPEPAVADERQHKRTAAYVYDRSSLNLRDSDANQVDQLNYSFALIKNGKVTGSHWQSIDLFQAYIEKHPHITPVMAVGGWGADGFSQAAATAEGRALFVESALELMEKYGFLGIDIDWEYPGSTAGGIVAHENDREHYTLLLKALRHGLDQLTARDGKPRLLAVALGAYPSLTENIDCKAVGQVVDQVNLMTYDMHTPKVATHHTGLYSTSERYPLSAHQAVKAYAAAGIPKNKLMLGAAFYARIYTLPSAYNDPVYAQATNNGDQTLLYKTLMAQTGWTHSFDEAAKAPYATNGTKFATYDNPTSIFYKGAYVLENNLMGMMCWEYGGDDSGELLRAMHQSLTP